MPDKNCGTCRKNFKGMVCYSVFVGEMLLKQMGSGCACPPGFSVPLRTAWSYCRGKFWASTDDAEYFRQPLDGGDDEPDKPVYNIKELLGS